jgi:prevent-host-death family protein
MSQPRTVSASDFKATCLGLLDEVRDSGTEVIITKRGKPVARLLPIGGQGRSLRGAWQGMARIRGDIVHVDWSADFEASR